MITRANYEEYFLLYVDDELTPEQKAAVEAFVLLHPDLKEELDGLCSTKVPADLILFEAKEELLADQMKVAAVDEALLLYIDNELPAWEQEAIEAQLKRDQAFALQHALLLKTKLQPEPMPYPHKKELYRRTEKRLVPYWLRVAAVVLLLAGSTAVWLNMDNPSNPATGIAAVPPEEKTPVTQPVIEITEKPVDATADVAAPKIKRLARKEAVLASNTTAAKKPSVKPIKEKSFSKPHTDVAAAVPSNNLPVVKKADAALKTGVAKKIQEALNNTTVTPDAASPYVTVTATENTVEPAHPVATTDEERGGGSVKGLLRKATRFIERRTGIKAVNDNNELLVGAVALKL